MAPEDGECTVHYAPRDVIINPNKDENKIDILNCYYRFGIYYLPILKQAISLLQKKKYFVIVFCQCQDYLGLIWAKVKIVKDSQRNTL